MDGLLVDTEMLKYEAYKYVFAKFNIKFSKEDYLKYWVKLGIGLETYLTKKHININSKIITSEKEKYFIKLINNSKLMPFDGVIELFKNLKKNNIKIVLATSSSYKETIVILNKINLLNYFDFIATKNDVKNKKPDTEIYQYILLKMNESAYNCISIEDSQKGTEPSLKLNIKTIAIPNKYTLNHNFDNVDLILDSIKKINLDLLNTLIKKGLK